MELGKIYKKNNETSYCLGGSLTYELLITKPQLIKHIYIHPDFDKSQKKDEFLKLIRQNNIHYSENEKIFKRLADKDKCTIIAEFLKYEEKINLDNNHLVLYNPGNMGNLGTIIRTAIAFNINDLVLIRPAVDIFDPKVIRASMGALFHCRFTYYDKYDDYLSNIEKRNIYYFRLNASEKLDNVEIPDKYSLVFGNESSGLPHEIDNLNYGIKIPISNSVDSLSLPMAIGISLYEFQKGKI